MNIFMVDIPRDLNGQKKRLANIKVKTSKLYYGIGRNINPNIEQGAEGKGGEREPLKKNKFQ